jgi:hypothetical protein
MDYSFPGSSLKFNPFDTKTDLTTFKYADAIAAPQSMTEGQFMGRLLPSLTKRLEQDAYNNSPEGMAKLLELGRQDAREKAKQQLMWGTLAKLPETIATAFGGGPNAQERFRQGMGAIPGIYANTLAAYPQIQVPGTSIQQNRYFT